METAREFYARRAIELDARGQAAVEAGDDVLANDCFLAAEACVDFVRLLDNLPELLA